jgi:hypothetical protein
MGVWHDWRLAVGDWRLARVVKAAFAELFTQKVSNHPGVPATKMAHPGWETSRRRFYSKRSQHLSGNNFNAPSWCGVPLDRRQRSVASQRASEIPGLPLNLVSPVGCQCASGRCWKAKWLTSKLLLVVENLLLTIKPGTLTIQHWESLADTILGERFQDAQW